MGKRLLAVVEEELGPDLWAARSQYQAPEVDGLITVQAQGPVSYTHLLSVPVVLGSGFYELFKAFKAGSAAFTWTILPGVLVAALVGYLAIKFFIRLLNKATTRYFSYYCWALAVIGIIALLFV